jgi:hypothetical protein|eukprot:evm.model.NODE_904_length_1409_cov_18.478354.1
MEGTKSSSSFSSSDTNIATTTDNQGEKQGRREGEHINEDEEEGGQALSEGKVKFESSWMLLEPRKGVREGRRAKKRGNPGGGGEKIEGAAKEVKGEEEAEGVVEKEGEKEGLPTSCSYSCSC